MDQNVLNNLKDGEQIVEMIECTLHNESVIKAIIYTCHLKTIIKLTLLLHKKSN